MAPSSYTGDAAGQGLADSGLAGAAAAAQGAMAPVNRALAVSSMRCSLNRVMAASLMDESGIARLMQDSPFASFHRNAHNGVSVTLWCALRHAGRHPHNCFFACQKHMQDAVGSIPLPLQRAPAGAPSCPPLRGPPDPGHAVSRVRALLRCRSCMSVSPCPVLRDGTKVHIMSQQADLPLSGGDLHRPHRRHVKAVRHPQPAPSPMALQRAQKELRDNRKVLTASPRALEGTAWQRAPPVRTCRPEWRTS